MGVLTWSQKAEVITRLGLLHINNLEVRPLDVGGMVHHH